MLYYTMPNKHHDQKYTKTRLDHYERLQKQLDAHETRKSLVEFRKNVLDKQKKMNYQNEYDRIRGLLSQTIIPRQTREYLETRKKNLAELGARAISGIA